MNYFRCGGGRSTHTATKIDVAKTPLATFESNVSGLYIPEILAYIQATQSGSGDPSPSNPREINGVTQVDTTRTGKNVWGGLTMANSFSGCIGYTLDTENKTFTFRRSYTLTNLPKFKENTQYTILLKATAAERNNSLRIFYTDESFTYLDIPQTSEKTMFVFTSDANKTISYIRLAFTQVGEVTVYYDESGMFEGALTTSDFVPYTGTTVTTNLGGTYYGCYLNVTTGLLTVTDAIVDLGSLTWTYRSGNKLFTAFKSGIKLSSDAKGTPCLCDIYKATYGGSWSGWANFPNEHISSGNNYSSGDANIAVKDLSYTDKDTFKTAMNGVKLVYELATPQTIQLTPAQLEQLLGQNNVFCSSGDVAVKFWKID